MKQNIKPSPRLEAIGEYIKSPVLYDIGTDHGFIPVYAVLNLGTECATASDINPLPLKKAEKLIRENGLSDKIKTVLCDGPDGLGITPPCDIVIAGMGGELISSMIERCDAFKNRDVHLILQPMTKAEILRKTLAVNGFEIKSETVVYDTKLYSVISAGFTGINHGYNEAELLIGKKAVQKDIKRYTELATEKSETLCRNAESKRNAGYDTEYEDKIISQIGDILK